MTTDKALAIIPRTVEEVGSLAARFAKSALLPPDLRGKEADVFVTIMAGAELGLPPMAALRGIFIVKGRPVLSADAMVGVVLGRGVAKYFSCVEEIPTTVTYETHREGAPHPQRCTWTLDDAKRAGLDGDNWRKYPRAMLKARCKAALARDVYPDVLAGCYDEDEVREFAPPSRNGGGVPDAIDAEVVAEVVTGNHADDEQMALIEDAPTVEALQAMAPSLAKLAEPMRSAARTRYKARMAELREVPT
jgi:hypothetical protein